MKEDKTDALIIMWISAGVSICLIPFIVLRILQHDWSIALLNSLAVLTAIFIFIHVYLSEHTQIARVGLSVLAIIVMASTVFLKGTEQIVWMYPSITIIFYLLAPKVALFTCSLFIVAITLLLLPDSSLLFVFKFLVSSFATVIFCFAFSSKMRAHASVLSQMALSDNLTGVGNRRALDHKLEWICNRLKRYSEQTCSLVIFDLDYFKNINDSYGHQFGDYVLKTFAMLIKQRIRSSDYIFRYGGEEFVVVLENTDITDAMILAKELAQELQDKTWDCESLCVTVSSGVAQFRLNDSAQTWLARADIALYSAKQAGRNCCLADQTDAMLSVRQKRQKVA